MTNFTRKTSNGLSIAFFGPDGAGKSAVIEALRKDLAPRFGGVHQFHFRPMLGGTHHYRPPEIDPHGKRARGPLISSLKLIYWLLDCWCGHLLLTRRALAASRLVIFDRYYYDILIDPVRYRLPNSCIGFARRLVPLAPAPDLCVLLDVPAEALQHRKQEVSFAESQRQRFAYREMFRSLPNTLLVNADCPLAEVTHQVSTAVLSFAGNVSRRQPEVLRIANP